MESSSFNIKTVLFVCIANQNRSPMAEALFRRYLEKLGRNDIVVKSAGTSTAIAEDTPIKENTLKVLQEVGINMSDKKRAFLSAEVMSSATCIILMESRNGFWIAEKYPEANHYFLFNEIRPDATSPDVPDPYGQKGELAVWRKVRDEIEGAIPDILDFIDNPSSEIAQYHAKTGVLERSRSLTEALRPFALNKVKELYAFYTQKLESWNQTNAQSVPEIIKLKASVSYWEDDLEGEIAEAIKIDQEWSLDLLHDAKYGLRSYSEELLKQCDQIKEALKSCRERFDTIGISLLPNYVDAHEQSWKYLKEKAGDPGEDRGKLKQEIAENLTTFSTDINNLLGSQLTEENREIGSEENKTKGLDRLSDGLRERIITIVGEMERLKSQLEQKQVATQTLQTNREKDRVHSDLSGFSGFR